MNYDGNQKKPELANKEYSNTKSENSDQGIDNWNDRLDQNLESEGHNDISADENAEDFSKKFGSGDQSDEKA
ncbi:hypothetical protein H7U22_16585 [Pedobacter sp. CCM 8938]|uniref:Uncharacterized protein n=1 Tax=Pedobacter fastidiosus TaxID=2765361 RepID=A0ABR7KWA9_9SPHI|nr:hypothetical protein [Pedobacter fastidiosus]